MIINKDIDNRKGFDWGKTSSDYAKFRDIYPDLFYQKIIDSELCIKGQKVLDLGTGTGILPRNLYKYGASFIGADISANQIEQARRLSAEAGTEIEYIIASAEEIDFPDKSFDVITACQCYIYFDKIIVPPKIYKMLKDDGHFCILSMIWLPYECKIAESSEKIVLKYNPSWTGAGFKRFEFTDVPEELKEFFEIENSDTFDLNINFTRESWHGRIKACRGIGASSLSLEEIAAFEREHIEYLNTLPESFDILHYAAILNLRKK